MDTLGETPRPRLAWTAVLALVAALGVVAGFFLPWLDLPPKERTQVVSRGDAERWERGAAERKEDGAPAARLRAWLDGGSLDGLGWLSVVGLALEHGQDRGIEAREGRAWQAAVVAVRALPIVAGLLALALLLSRLRPMSTGLLAGCLLVAIVVAALGALLGLGASAHARETIVRNPRVLGAGLGTIGVSGLLLAVAGLVGVRRETWWKAWLLALGLAVALVLGTGIYVAG